MSIHHHELQHDNPVLSQIVKGNRKFYHAVVASDTGHVELVYDDAGVILESTLTHYPASGANHHTTGASMKQIQDVMLDYERC